MRTIHYLSMAVLALAACGGDDSNNNNNGSGDEVTPTANGVFPAQSFAGHELRVEVSGDATTWSATTTVSFGAGITVNSVAVASPTDLIADITIPVTAAAGLNDVVVTDGSNTFTLSKAFEVDSQFTFTTTGTLAQGSIALFSITANDLTAQFDATSVLDIFGDASFPNLNFTAPSGVALTATSADIFHISGQLTIDTDATSGALTLASGPTGTTTTFTFPDVTIATRTATALTSGTPVAGTTAASLQSDLYTFTSGTGPAAVTFSATSAVDGASPTFFLLPASGHWADLVTSGATFAEIDANNADQFFAIYVDAAGGTGAYSIEAESQTIATTVGEVASDNTPALAQALTVLPEQVNASLPDDDDVDFYKFTLAAGDVGKHIHVITSSGDTVDTAVEIFGPNSSTTSFDTSSDLDLDEDLDSVATTAAGTYFIEVSNSADNAEEQAFGDYALVVFLD